MYTLNTENIPDPSCVAPLALTYVDCMMPGVQITTGLGFFHSVAKVWVKLIVPTPYPQAYSLLTGP